MKFNRIFCFCVYLSAVSCAKYDSVSRHENGVMTAELKEKMEKSLSVKFKENEIIDKVDVQPEIIGGLPELYKYIYFPEEARAEGISGTVIVLLTIDKSGKMVHQEIVNSLGYGCDEVVLNAISKVTFKPGIKGNVPVPCYLFVPVKFSLKK